MRRTLLASLVQFSLLAAFAFGQYHEVPKPKLSLDVAGFPGADGYELLPAGEPVVNLLKLEVAIYEGEPDLARGLSIGQGALQPIARHQISLHDGIRSELVVDEKDVNPPAKKREEYVRNWRDGLAWQFPIPKAEEKIVGHDKIQVTVTSLENDTVHLDMTIEKTGINNQVSNGTAVFTTSSRFFGNFKIGKSIPFRWGTSSTGVPLWAEVKISEAHMPVGAETAARTDGLGQWFPRFEYEKANQTPAPEQVNTFGPYR